MIARVGVPAAGGVIRVRGARQHNLKGIDLDIPLHRLTVVTGVSGSGKSSLAFDTLYAEGQRRYVETFSAYTRQFLERLAAPDADSIEGIPPAVAIDQSGAVKTSRSTVGTMTGINDYLKLIFARRAEPWCPECGAPAAAEDARAVEDHIAGLDASDYPAVIAAPIPLGGFGGDKLVGDSLRAQGYVRFLRGREVRPIADLKGEDAAGDELWVVMDRLASPQTAASRRAESAEQAFRVGRGRLKVLGASGRERVFSEGVRCGGCGRDFPRPTPGLFSFNNPFGACPECRGFGRVIELDLGRVIPDDRLSIRDGAIRPWNTESRREKRRDCLRFCAGRGIPIDVPFSSLTAEQRRLVIDGAPGFPGVRGFFRRLEKKKYKMHVRVLLARYRGYAQCPACAGGRLRPEALLYRMAGSTLPNLWGLAIHELIGVFDGLAPLPAFADRGARLILDEVRSRLSYLDDVGLGYLSLGRQSRTLSGGEVERVNLTAALGASLVESLFVLDEPSIGLHARDNARLLSILRAIRDRGNTVLVVEHDPAILSAADHLIDLGPAAGAGGGRVVAQGTVDEVKSIPGSRTGAFLSGRESIEPPRRRRPLRPGRRIAIRGARSNNLRGLDVDIPLDLLVAVTGVSGSGKSTLIEDVLWRNCGRAQAKREGGDSDDPPGDVRSIEGVNLVDEVVLVDQSPIGRTSRGNPATYIKVYEHIRKRFAGSADAVRLRLGARHFSFNVEGGRCPECSGSGYHDVEMQFLSDVRVPCEACGGKRFQANVLQARYRGLNIHQALELTVRQALEFFDSDPEIQEPLSLLDSLGLGYLRLGQPINTLSGGEAERLKLAGRALTARRERILFLLDEPTTGLHLADVATLLGVLQAMVDRGHSVVVIEHHLDVIRSADWIIDLGPEGGEGGGELVAQGPPEEIAASPRSVTGLWLRGGGREESAAAPPAAPPAGPQEADAPPAGGAIRVVGARENNLRSVTVEIPREKLVVVTGMSGSGKSSLLYDIVFAEGQRRYLDCLSPYARQFVEDLHRPDLDHLEGIPPAVAIEQRTTIGGRKSTVGTVTEIYHFLRLLFARAGVQRCPDCGLPVTARTREELLAAVEKLVSAKGGRLLAQVVRGKKGTHAELLRRARKIGILDARIDGQWVAIPADRPLALDRYRPHDIDLLVARFRAGAVRRAVLVDALDLALELGEGAVKVLDPTGAESVLSSTRSCPSCRRDFEPMDPHDFSFNSARGACGDCEGYGSRLVLDPERLIEHWDEPLSRSPGGPLSFLDEPPFTRRDRRRVERWLDESGLPLEKKPADLGARSRAALLDGRDDFPGLIPFADERLARLDPSDAERFLLAHGREEPCASCGGSRLKREAASVEVGGLRIADMTRLPVRDLRPRLAALELAGRDAIIGGPIVAEVMGRLGFLDEVGLGYLALGRSVDTLSGGEAQRIRLAAQLGSNLRGACYILDEPTIGLHPVENEKLIRALRALRDRGNSVLVIEHDESTIAAADHVIEMGPGPGRLGGRVVAQGTLADIIACPDAPTGRWLRSRMDREAEARPPGKATPPAGPWLEIQGACLHNLRRFDVRIPLGARTVVTGVSGAGKSTLVRDVLEECVRSRLRGLTAYAAGCRDVKGWSEVRAVREVDQLPIGRTPRSTPATYVGFWSRIRNIFASCPEARMRGYGPARFSFNVPGGRCDRCQGQGRIRMEMSFLPDVYLDCDRCRGDRFEAETLRVTYRGRSIGDVLRQSVDEARETFLNIPEVARPLQVLSELGLGYLTLGQASNTLSGGEAERVKLAVELAKTSEGRTLYVLDEPTIGLHLLDVEGLIRVLDRLAAAGHAVVVIEHNLEVIAGADWVIDLGPGGGAEGGELLYQGPPAGLLACDTPTGRSLRERARQSQSLPPGTSRKLEELDEAPSPR